MATDPLAIFDPPGENVPSPPQAGLLSKLPPYQLELVLKEGEDEAELADLDDLHVHEPRTGVSMDPRDAVKPDKLSKFVRLRMFAKYLELMSFISVASYFQTTLRVVKRVALQDAWEGRIDQIWAQGQKELQIKGQGILLERARVLQQTVEKITPELLLSRLDGNGLIKLLEQAAQPVGKPVSPGNVIVAPGNTGTVQVNTGQSSGTQSLDSGGTAPADMSDEAVRAELERLGFRIQPPVVPSLPTGTGPSGVGAPPPPGSVP